MATDLPELKRDGYIGDAPYLEKSGAPFNPFQSIGELYTQNEASVHMQRAHEEVKLGMQRFDTVIEYIYNNFENNLRTIINEANEEPNPYDELHNTIENMGKTEVGKMLLEHLKDLIDDIPEPKDFKKPDIFSTILNTFKETIKQANTEIFSDVSKPNAQGEYSNYYVDIMLFEFKSLFSSFLNIYKEFNGKTTVQEIVERMKQDNGEGPIENTRYFSDSTKSYCLGKPQDILKTFVLVANVLHTYFPVLSRLGFKIKANQDLEI